MDYNLTDHEWGVVGEALAWADQQLTSKVCWQVSSFLSKKLEWAQESGYYVGQGLREGHYWNRLNDGTIVDASFDQFGEDPVEIIPPDDYRQKDYEKAVTENSKLRFLNLFESTISLYNGRDISLSESIQFAQSQDAFGTVIAALSDGEEVGRIILEDEDVWCDGLRWISIKDVWVSPKQRRTGIGEKLYLAALDRLTEFQGIASNPEEVHHSSIGGLHGRLSAYSGVDVHGKEWTLIPKSS